MAIPEAAYRPAIGSPLSVDGRVYSRFAESRGRTVEMRRTIGVRTGFAWKVRAGQIARISTPEGPQVVDLNLWSSDDPRERFWAARTRQFYGAHLGVFERLWSCLPFLRPMATMIADTLNYGLDEDGAGCHDLLGTRCDPYVRSLLSGEEYDYHCHSNLVRSIREFGLTEFDVHDVINLFQVTGMRPDDERYYMKASPARAGDFVEFFAEIDLTLAVSVCPGGDLAVPLFGPDAVVEPACRPIMIEVFTLPAEDLEGWIPPSRCKYEGMNGVRHAIGQDLPIPPPVTKGVPPRGAGGALGSYRVD